MRRSRSKALPAAPRPWRCAILAVDPGDSSGWSLWVNGRLSAFGSVDGGNQAAMLRVVEDAVVRALESVSSLLLVRERPYSRRILGPSWGMWDRAWEHAGLSKRRIVKVWPATWLARVCGSSKASKARQMQSARGICALEGKVHAGMDHDEAAAICIGRWATYAGEVGRVLGKRAMREMGMVTP